MVEDQAEIEWRLRHKVCLVLVMYAANGCVIAQCGCALEAPEVGISNCCCWNTHLLIPWMSSPTNQFRILGTALYTLRDSPLMISMLILEIALGC